MKRTRCAQEINIIRDTHRIFVYEWDPKIHSLNIQVVENLISLFKKFIEINNFEDIILTPERQYQLNMYPVATAVFQFLINALNSVLFTPEIRRDLLISLFSIKNKSIFMDDEGFQVDYSKKMIIALLKNVEAGKAYPLVFDNFSIMSFLHIIRNILVSPEDFKALGENAFNILCDHYFSRPENKETIIQYLADNQIGLIWFSSKLLRRFIVHGFSLGNPAPQRKSVLQELLKISEDELCD